LEYDRQRVSREAWSAFDLVCPKELCVPQPSRRPIWLHSERFLARNLGRPVQRFLHIEAASGILLLATTVMALAWANSPWSAAYHDLWTTEVTIDVGGHVAAEDLRHWVNDG
jgi:NhaA family Na+:H+ antiporter